MFSEGPRQREGLNMGAYPIPERPGACYGLMSLNQWSEVLWEAKYNIGSSRTARIMADPALRQLNTYSREHLHGKVPGEMKI